MTHTGTLKTQRKNKKTKIYNILIADDDPDDRLLTSEALSTTELPFHLSYVENGEELIQYLKHSGEYQALSPPRPDLILMDLSMPQKNGFEALQILKSDPALRQIPIVVLSTSREQEDIFRTYDLGVNSYVTKAQNYGSLIHTIQILGKYWLEVVQLPSDRNTH